MRTKQHLFLVPGVVSIGGMQKFHRTLIRAWDEYLGKRCGHLLVLSLNDPHSIQHKDLQGLSATELVGFDSNRLKFSRAALRSFRQAEIVTYGLFGFSPLVFFQTILSPQPKSIVLLHGVEVWERRGRLYEYAAQKLSDVVSISQCTLTKFHEAYPSIHRCHDFILPCSLDPLRSADISALDSTSVVNSVQNPPRLLSVARLEANEAGKGIDTVICALPELLRRFPNLQYVIVGDGSDRPNLEELARKKGVYQAVRFCGFVSESMLENEYRQCTAYVMPSASEGFGLVFIEAMSHGKPVVAAKVGGTPEVVLDGITGILVDLDDVPNLVQALTRLLENQDWQIQLGQAGLHRVQQEYTYDVFHQRVAQIMNLITDR